jgi:arylsulfatase A-like enzyme
MDSGCSKSDSEGKGWLSFGCVYRSLARRAYTVIMFGSLFCTLVAKFFHSWRTDLVDEYLSWIYPDVSFLLTIEVILSLVCFRWPRRWVFRTATIVAAIMCTWSVINAAWLIRTGTQILPAVLLTLFRDPLNTLGMVGVNLIRMPTAAIALLGPSAIALTFFFFVLARPMLPNYNRRLFASRIAICLVIVIFAAVMAQGQAGNRGSPPAVSEGLRYNCHLRAVMGFFLPASGQVTKSDLAGAKRKIPALDQVQITLQTETQPTTHNVVVLVLEGIQYKYTSLYDKDNNLTPHLAALADQGAQYAAARSSLNHTTKALFALLTGRFPSSSHDIVEAVPAVKPYASIATILKQKLNFRTAFFQSAKGTFESRPALVYNLGFEKFWARDDSNNPDAFIGYLGCDEFAMLEPIREWIGEDKRPFLLTVLCSVTHDPYEVPRWFALPAREPIERYRQAISYTDKFIAALDAELAKLNLVDKTILCVVGDHGEAFGEHGLLGHERIGYDEVYHVPCIIRSPFLVKPATKVTQPVSSVDVTPTLLALLGFNTNGVGFDGINVLGHIPHGRKVYFCDWKHEGPTGFVKGDHKFIYNPTNGTVSLYDLSTDPLELTRVQLPEQQDQKIADEIVRWRKNNIFQPKQERTGKKMLFGRWLCRWTDRVCLAKYYPAAVN